MIYVNYPTSANGFKESPCPTRVLLGTCVPSARMCTCSTPSMHFTSASTNSNSNRRSQTAFVFDVCLAGFDVDVKGGTYRVVQELHDEGGHAAVDADEEVDAGEDHVRCAGHAEDEGGRVHERSDGPADTNR